VQKHHQRCLLHFSFRLVYFLLLGDSTPKLAGTECLLALNSLLDSVEWQQIVGEELLAGVNLLESLPQVAEDCMRTITAQLVEISRNKSIVVPKSVFYIATMHGINEYSLPNVTYTKTVSKVTGNKLINCGGDACVLVHTDNKTVGVIDFERQDAKFRDIFKSQSEIRAIAYVPGKGVLVTVEKTIVLFSLGSVTEASVRIREFAGAQGHTESVFGIDVFPGGDRFLSGSYDDTAKVWTIHDGTVVCDYKGHGRSDVNVVVCVSEDVAASGSDDLTVHVWNARTGARLHILQGHSGHVTKLIANRLPLSDVSLLISADNSMIKVWNANLGVVLQTIEATGCLSLCSLGHGLFSGTFENGIVKIWNLSNYSLKMSVPLTEKDDVKFSRLMAGGVGVQIAPPVRPPIVVLPANAIAELDRLCSKFHKVLFAMQILLVRFARLCSSSYSTNSNYTDMASRRWGPLCVADLVPMLARFLASKYSSFEQHRYPSPPSPGSSPDLTTTCKLLEWEFPHAQAMRILMAKVRLDALALLSDILAVDTAAGSDACVSLFLNATGRSTLEKLVRDAPDDVVPDARRSKLSPASALSLTSLHARLKKLQALWEECSLDPCRVLSSESKPISMESAKFVALPPFPSAAYFVGSTHSFFTPASPRLTTPTGALEIGQYVLVKSARKLKRLFSSPRSK
jgi:WD40 repeat protein